MSCCSWKVCVAVILMFPWGALSSCPPPCLCEGGSVINCSSMAPLPAPLLVPASVAVLDLSRNGLPSLPLAPRRAPLPQLTHLHLGHNRLTHLSLCQSAPRGPGPCASWAPSLDLLSAENNLLEHIPEGVCGAAALHTLHLSHNRISTLTAQDLQACTHLRELHLQGNLLSSLPPLAFTGLHELQILDLSENVLGAFPGLAYLWLRGRGTQVEVSGNPWRCDCGLRDLRRAVGVATHAPPLLCAEPPVLAGRELQHLHLSLLTCSTPGEGAGLHQELTLRPGAEIVLPCRQDLSRAVWWTPDGSVRRVDGERGGGLRIRGVTEQDQGFYVCFPGPREEPAGLFSMRVRAGAREEGAEPAGRGGDRTRADLALAVCLSVFLTFIVAFALGALTRPLLDVLWGKIRARRRPPPVTTATPHDNRGFSETEGSEGKEGAELGAGTPYYITVHPEPDGAQRPWGGRERDTGAEEEGLSRAGQENLPPPEGPGPQLAPARGRPPPQGEGPGGAEPAHVSSTGADQSDSSSEEGPAHHSYTMEFEPIPDPQDLGIDDLDPDTARDRDLKPDLDPGTARHHDLKPDLDPGTARHRDLEPDLDPGTARDRDLEPDLDPDPDRDLGRDPCDLSDPFPISRGRFEAGWPHSSTPPGEAPFPAPDWMDSPWEPSPPAPQARLPDSFPPDLDPDLWTDSGESFEFSDALQQEATRGSPSLALQPEPEQGPWSPFHQSAAREQGSHDPTLLAPGEQTTPPFLTTPPVLTSLPHPQQTGGPAADAPWVIHREGGNAGLYTDGDTELPGVWPHGSPDDPELWFSLGQGQDPAPLQHPTLTDPLYPIKPRRSFTLHATTLQDTPTPTENTPPPTEDMPTPTEDTPSPTEDTPTLLQDTPSPTEDTPTPLQATPTPLQAMPAPTEEMPSPTEDTPTPLQATPTPTEDRPSPTEDTPTPTEDTPSPTYDTPPPLQDMPTPTEDTPSPTDITPTLLYLPQLQATPPPLQDTPTPTEDTPSPTDITPTLLYLPQLQATPTPLKDTPIPQEYTPTPREDTPSPLQDMPTPTEDTPSPTDITPTLLYLPQLQATPPPLQDTPTPTEDTPSPTDITPTLLYLPQLQATPPPLQDTPTPTEDTPSPTDITPTLLYLPQLQATPTPLKDAPIPQEYTPTPREDTPPPLHPPRQQDTPTPLRPTQREDTEGAWPMVGAGLSSPPSQGSQRQDWRRGGLFFQKRRAMDAFAPPSQAPPPPLPGSAHISCSSITIETVTMAAGWSPPGEISAEVAEEGDVTSDSTSCFLLGPPQDKGSEA